MVLVQHFVSPSTLPKQLGIPSLSVLSYNVLLPNSYDGWWTYKMYNPPLKDDSHSSWDFRRDLLKERIQLVNADVVCLQEVAPESFEDDFSFMQDLGYDGFEMFKKGRFRPATFWKTSQCQLAAPAVHKDRSLLTAFECADSDQNWYICNCHLQAGKQAPRRVRQIHEAMRAVLTLAKKQKGSLVNKFLEPEPAKSVRLIVTGDFNGGPECGAVRYLENGFIDDTFREDGEPVSSGRKDLPFSSPLIDVASMAERTPPPTMVVSELMSTMMQEATYDNPILSQGMLDRLQRVYSRLATDNGQMSSQDVEQWLVKINKQLGRGDEFRQAAKEMGWEDPNPEDPYEERKKRVQLPKEGTLPLGGFIEVYRKELNAGKFWGIAHDMAVLGDPLPDIGLYSARFDRMYCSSALQPTAVLDTVTDKGCPNDKEPSDHLPVAACFKVAS